MEGKFIIYQLLLRTFGDRQWTPGGTYVDNGSGKFTDITLKQLKAWKRQLSLSAIWYTGVIDHATTTEFQGVPASEPNQVKGKAGSPYAIRNYYDVAPELAKKCDCRMAEFEAMIERTHKAGLKAFIDFVPNHTACGYRSETSPFSKENYHLNHDGTLYHDGDWTDTAKLNYGNRDTWEKMLGILRFWAGKGVDGFRCDLVELVPPDFFEWTFRELRKEFPHLTFIAEVYQKERYREYLAAGFDYLYDKCGTYDALKAISRGERSADTFSWEWQSLGDLQPHMLNFLENHDEQRIASQFFLGNGMKAKPALMCSLLFNTAPFMIYSGQEYGEKAMVSEGFSGVDGRTSIFDFCTLSGEKDYQVEEMYEELLKLAAGDEVFRIGDTYDLIYLNRSDKVVSFIRSCGKKAALVVASFAHHDIEMKVSIPQEVYDFLKIERFKPFEETLKIQPYNGLIIKNY